MSTRFLMPGDKVKYNGTSMTDLVGLTGVVLGVDPSFSEFPLVVDFGSIYFGSQNFADSELDLVEARSDVPGVA